MLSERFLALCLIGLGIVAMRGGLAVAAMWSASPRRSRATKAPSHADEQRDADE
jgi:hypothetical protein